MSLVHVVAMLLASPAADAPAAAGPIADERRLPPAEVERILEQAARRRMAADKALARGIEGEMGVSVGTGGYREVFGTAVVPVGKDATAIISIGSESERPKRRR